MKNLVATLVACTLLCSGRAASAADGLFVMQPAVYAPEAPLAESLRGCGADTLVADYVVDRLGKQFPGTTAVREQKEVGAGTVVNLTILALQGAGGGAWSGAKSITVRVDLYKGGNKVATQTFVRNSRGGVLGGVSGSCPIVDKISGALADDVTVWMRRQVYLQAGLADSLVVQIPATLATGVQLKEAIRSDCAVEMKFAMHAFESVSHGRAAIVQGDAGMAGSAERALRLSIDRFEVQGYDAPPGPQMIAVRADLVSGNTVLASKTFERDVVVGVSPAQIGGTTCYYIDRAAINMGKDIAAWLWKDGAYQGAAQPPAAR